MQNRPGCRVQRCRNVSEIWELVSSSEIPVRYPETNEKSPVRTDARIRNTTAPCTPEEQPSPVLQTNANLWCSGGDQKKCGQKNPPERCRLPLSGNTNPLTQSYPAPQPAPADTSIPASFVPPTSTDEPMHPKTVVILAPPLYAWTEDSHFGRCRARCKATCDYRWLDRTHTGTASEHRD